MVVVGGRPVLTLFWNASSRFTVVRILSESLRGIGLPFGQVSCPLELRAIVPALIIVSAVRYRRIPWPCSPQREHSYGSLTVRELDVDALARRSITCMYPGLGKKASSVWCLSWAIQIKVS